MSAKDFRKHSIMEL